MSWLRRHERKTLLTLRELGGRASVEEVSERGCLAHAAAMRAILTLSKENLVKVHQRKLTVISLSEEGKRYAGVMLPERRLIRSIIELGGEAAVNEAVKAAELDEAIVPIALGWLKRKRWGTIKDQVCAADVKGEPPLGNDERLLRLVSERESIIVDELDAELRKALPLLKGRKLVKLKDVLVQRLELTEKGWKLAQRLLGMPEEVTQLTPELIVTGKWRNVRFAKFNVIAPGPAIYPGKVHPLQQVIQLTREIFLEMGFTEIRGPFVETAFWNFDALFEPQDHPVRELMDTFYLANPSVGRLPRKGMIDAVAKVHEDGWVTGSKGWGYKWDPEEARKLVLRTHTTAETIKYLSRHKKPPIKVFSVDRAYRNERITYKSLAEFHQFEGIIVDENATFRDLMETLRTFFSKFGLKGVEFWPSYFPFTEPSAQAVVYHQGLKRWIELCGMGMFRPEVLAPVGVKHPVLAWGGGLERLAMMKLGLDDVRLLYSNNLKWLREAPVCR